MSRTTAGNQLRIRGLGIQPRLEVSAPDDACEREADNVAERVMRMPADAPSGLVSGNPVPGAGDPLSASARAFFEPRFGRSFASVRLHTNATAARFARSVNALAYTYGDHIVFDSGQYQAATPSGRRLMAHELAHVVQQSQGAHARVQRFTAGERDNISSLDQVVNRARTVADQRGGLGMMRWGRFTAGMRGSGALETVAPSSGSTATSMPHRYLFTCQCGLIDMRHFYQLMYIALLEGNRAATEMGREHELNAEETSRFAPEDTLSNAMGALFGDEQSWVETQATFVANLRTFLQRCGPIDFSALAAAEQTAVVDFYAARAASGAPLHPSESALPAFRDIETCRGSGMFPFVLAGGDENLKTLSGTVEETP